LTKGKTCCKIVLKLILRLRERRVNMAIETVQEKNKRLTKEVQELKKPWLI
jgi:phosphoglycerate-specific signal transduction histidine kinase